MDAKDLNEKKEIALQNNNIAVKEEERVNWVWHESNVLSLRT